MPTEKEFTWYLTFVSIIFGVFISVWVEPIEYLVDSKLSGDKEWWQLTIYVLVGLFMFGILICLWWWYGMFIGQIAPARGFQMYGLDFAALALFAFAANFWHKPIVFTGAEVLASIPMAYRFHKLRTLVRKGSNHQKALKSALKIIIGAPIVILVLIAILMLPSLQTFVLPFLQPPLGFDVIEGIFGGIVICLMAMGIGVTIKAVQTTEGLSWGSGLEVLDMPDKLAMIVPDTDLVPDKDLAAAFLVASHAKHDFEDKVRKSGLTEHRRIHLSTVHSLNDVGVQAQILCIPSIGTGDQVTAANEVRNKGLLTYFGHWLDDIFDQSTMPGMFDRLKMAIDNDSDPNRKYTDEWFIEIFRDTLLERRSESGRALFNFLESNFNELTNPLKVVGFTRLYLGSRVFHKGGEAREARQYHRKVLDHWLGDKKGILDGFPARDGLAALGGEDIDRFITLTTKTVQELWFGLEDPLSLESDEAKKLESFYLTFLYSLLLGPALYYHNHPEEAERKELDPEWLRDYDGESLETTSDDKTQLDSGKATLLIRHVKEILTSEVLRDPRARLRGLQIRVVASSFVSVLPDNVQGAYEEVGGKLMKPWGP